MGDAILLEMRGCFQRYTAPMMRTVSIGKPDSEVTQMANACLTALDNVLAAIRPGISAHEVARAGWEGINQAGGDIVFHGSFGYAVGAGFPPTWADGTASITLGEQAILQPAVPPAMKRLKRKQTKQPTPTSSSISALPCSSLMKSWQSSARRRTIPKCCTSRDLSKDEQQRVPETA